jgi:hypothetical protein
LFNKGAILASEQKKSEAIAVWKRLIRHAPNSEEAVTAKGFIAQLEKQ